MNKFFGFAILGCAVIAGMPANAANTNYTFNFINGANNSDLSSYSNTSNGVTATAVAFYATGTSSTGPTSNFIGGKVGEYNGAGLGVCETQTSTNCSDPNHQINNGTNLSLYNNGGTTDDFEFVLFQFSASVNLSNITLGNFGTTGSTSDPFIATYLTSTSGLSLSAMQAALAGTTVGNLAGTNGFGSATQTTCTTGCSVNDTGTVETLSGTGVTYLLIGASDLPGAAGKDFFKIQDIAAYNTSGGGQSATPEPATFGLIGLALTGLGIYTRKQKSGKS